MTLEETFRKDYKAPLFSIEKIKLNFILNEEITTVNSILRIIPKEGKEDEITDLYLNGQKDVKLKIIKLDGKELSENAYILTENSLTIKNVPKKEFNIEIEVEIKPQENTALEGLYKSSGVYCTQNEAEGFRYITYFMDRPDIMSKYEVRIEAEKSRYPILLSNGNLIITGDLENGRHYAIWEDPFLKPCYLFALVAGDLGFKEDYFVTMSNRKIKLRIYSEHKNINKVEHALFSLKQAMKWDEERFGREYDLENFNIVAVDDFNMGAMENKSLNIFNSDLLLASMETSTDNDFKTIQAVIGHEYFHNWTGNRITCRDWFQLTLKEGLTVFRESEFTADLNSAAVKRIQDASYLRASQFNEDAGPLAHPIRPDSYAKIDNFYTATVYEKGSEIIRLYQTILGKDGFRKGMDLYFERHDGQAVTCEEFLMAMADANEKDLSSILIWYSQAGTPVLTIRPEYDVNSKMYRLHVHQETPATPKQIEKLPVMIPIKMALLDKYGKEIELKDNGVSLGKETILEFDVKDKVYEFEGINERPILSALRDFSAPVKMKIEDQTIDDLIFLIGNDTDPFNKWEANQIICKKIILDNYNTALTMGDNYHDKMKDYVQIPETLFESFRKVLIDKNLDGFFIRETLSLPSPSELYSEIKEADPLILTHLINFIIKQIAIRLASDFENVLRENDIDSNEEYTHQMPQSGRRALKNLCLYYLIKTGEKKYITECETRYYTATNMTDTMAALASINHIDTEERTRALQHFYEKWKDDYLVTLKWLALQSSSNIPNNLSAVNKLLSHEAYNIKNPNCNYDLLCGFARSAVNFHAKDGSGYDWLADILLKLDAVNAQVASRIVTIFTKYKFYDKKRQELIINVLKRILDKEDLSENTKEIVTKALEL